MVIEKKKDLNEKPGFGFTHPHSMLHQTLPALPSMQSLCFSSSLPPFSPSLVKKEMEGVGISALKTSFLQEANVKASNEDVWVENIVPGDDFFVDDLLDFSKDEVFNEEENEFVSVEEKQSESVDGVSVKDVFSELSVPADDVEMEQLEWLSQFVEDSELSHKYPEQNQNPFVKFKNPNQSVSVTEKSEILRAPVPGKPRSKRSRKGVQVWSLGSSSTHTETSNSSSSSSSSSGSGSSVSNPRLIFTPTPRNFDIFHSFNAPPPKKQKKRTEAAQVQRRCSHCGVQKTPQWRQGPHGAKTLCNACGVRYKSGRLLPEYRPACSPTFSSEVHSNNHRKVLEMRMKKETARPDLVRPVQSF